MARFDVTMSRPGGGGGTFEVQVYASTPDEARRIAMAQYVGYSAQAVRRLYG